MNTAVSTKQEGSFLFAEHREVLRLASVSSELGRRAVFVFVTWRMLTHAQSPSFRRSEDPLVLGRWHELRVSRTAKNGILQVDKQKVVEGMAEVRTHLCS